MCLMALAIKGRNQDWMKSVVEGQLFLKMKKTLASLNVNEKNIGKEKRVEYTEKLVT